MFPLPRLQDLSTERVRRKEFMVNLPPVTLCDRLEKGGNAKEHLVLIMPHG
jgi:hypothetical protein